MITADAVVSHKDRRLPAAGGHITCTRGNARGGQFLHYSDLTAR